MLKCYILSRICCQLLNFSASAPGPGWLLNYMDDLTCSWKSQNLG